LSNPELIEELRWQLKQIEERKAENQRLLTGMTSSSADRVVTVVTGAGGVVRDVRLAPEAMQLDAGTLGRAITKAIRDAGARPRREVVDDEPYDTVFDV
jgi:DNA-binding protein YbaB